MVLLEQDLAKQLQMNTIAMQRIKNNFMLK